MKGGRRMGTIKEFFRNNSGKWLLALVSFFAAALLPEYIFPVLLFVSYIKNIKIKGNGKASVGSLGVCMLLYALWQVIGLFYSDHLTSGLSSIGIWCFMFGGYLMMRSAVDSSEKLDAVILTGALSGGVAGGIGIGQMVLYHYGELIHPALKSFFNPFWHQLDNFIADFAINHLLPDFILKHVQRTQFISIITRASGTFTNPVFYAIFLTVMLPFSAYCMFYFHSKRKKALGLICLALTLGGIAASYSRGPYLAMAAAFVILLFYGGKRTLVLLGCGAGGLAALAVFADGVFKRLLSIFNFNDVSVSTRSKIWEACAEILEDCWVFGLGTGVNNVREILHNTYGIKQPHAHNIVLQIMLENGIVGLAVFAAILVVFAVNMIKLSRLGGRARGLAISLLASITAFCMCGMTDYPFYGLKPMCYMMLIFGLSAAAVRIYRQPKS